MTRTKEMVAVPAVGNFASYFIQPCFSTALARFYLVAKRKRVSGEAET